MESSLSRPLTQSLRCNPQKFNRRPFFFRPNSTASDSTKPKLTWAEYLAIRRGKRKWEMAATIPCAILGFAGGAAYFGSLETDATKPIMGVDPLFFYGGCTLACVGLGSLIGPTIGSSLWRLTHRHAMKLIDDREREFFQHIAKNRVDPSYQSPTNPIPDFYGEKIGSLHQYRQWLRDQIKYKRKATLPEK